MAPRPTAPPRRSGADDLPIISLKPLDDARPRPASARFVDRLGEGLSAVVAAVYALMHRFRSPAKPAAPPVPSNASAAVGAGSAPLPPREPVRAPPPINDLPVLRLAETPEPEVEEDVYEGESVLTLVWLWTKRLVLIAVVVAGGAAAALNWERWFPRALEVGRMLAADIHDYTRAKNEAERQAKAVQEAAEQLPQLSRDTISFIVSLDAEGAPDPPEVFRVTYEAAARGAARLDPAEAEELRGLEDKLLATLRPTERERLREYDRVRGRRPPFPFENRGALEILARGARVMSDSDRERLQALTGKAVAAGLGAPAETVQ
jgi:hypothetical protein